MYFIIPEDILGSGNPVVDTTVYLDNGIQLRSTTPALRYPFGEGYSLTLPTGPRQRVFSGSFSNRPSSEIALIKNYFEFLEGEPINGFSILGTDVTVRTLSFKEVPYNEESSSILAEFEETP